MSLRIVLIFFIFILSSCTISPGFKLEPNKESKDSNGLKRVGITLKFHNLNKIFHGISTGPMSLN